MDSDTWIQSGLLFILLMGAIFFAAAETSYASMNKIRIQNHADRGDTRAPRALFISANFDQALTAIIIGNNLTHIGFASLATLLSTRLWGVQSVKYTVIASTIIVFLFSELIPKSYAKANSEKCVLGFSGLLEAVVTLLTPVSKFFSGISRWLMNFLPEGENDTYTSEEFMEIIHIVEENGGLDEKRKELLHSAVNFDRITVGEIYTPLAKVQSISMAMGKNDIMSSIKEHKYSRMPVYDGSNAHPIGILQATQFLKSCVVSMDFDLRDILLEPFFVASDTLANDLLKEMSLKNIHLSIVTDRDAKVLGIITQEDIIEQLMGEIWDEDDIVDE